MHFMLLIETERPKKLGVFINPIGGSQNSLNVYSKTISPLFRAANIVCDVMGKHAGLKKLSFSKFSFLLLRVKIHFHLKEFFIYLNLC